MMTKLLITTLFLPYLAWAQGLPTGSSSELDETDVAAPTVSNSNSAKAKGGPKDNAATGGNKKTQTVDFEDELIQGEVNKPELFYLLQQKQFNFKRLIKLREDFLPEMRRTAEDIKRGGGSN